MNTFELERRYSWFSLLLITIQIAVLGFIPTAIFFEENVYTAFWGLCSILAALAAMLLIRRLLRSRFLSRRSFELEQTAIQNNWQFQKKPLSSDIAQEFYTSLLKLPDARNQTFKNYINTPSWSFFDLEYDTYDDIKGFEYKNTTIYHSVMVIKLPRALPHIIFDSRKAHGRQLKILYSQDQRHSLEGDFDTHFETYFIEEYVIDSLSIISPEVMQALIDANEYDIEISGDNVAMYGPYATATFQLQDMQSKILKIQNKLMNNILSYRDERLPFAQGRAGVAPLGMSLKSHKKSYVVTIVGVVIWIIAQLYFEITQ